MAKRSKGGYVAKIVLVLSLVALIVVAFMGVRPYVMAEYQMKDVTSESAEETSLIDWEHWLDVNPDIVGWIVVPGTNIDYPIVQASKDDPDFYLDHDVYGEYNIYGCPYVSANNDGLDDVAPIIYGHHMINNSMFSDFANMTDRSYADAHSEIIIMTPDETRKLDVLAAKVVNANVFRVRTGFTLEDMRDYYGAAIADASMRRELPSSDVERVYTFITCSYTTFNNERTLVYGAEKEMGL